MEHDARSIRPFIGSKDFKLSRSFYRDLGFKENLLNADMSLFTIGQMAFYLQALYVKEWIDNTMIFLEVDDIKRHWEELQALNLAAKYPAAKLTAIRIYDWGKECFLHDPSGICWHFGEFN